MASRGRPPHPDILTPREWEVLTLLRERLSNEQIAERLGITERTARFHVSEILSKLGLASREEAALWNPEERKPGWLSAFHWPLKWSMIAKIAGAGLLAGTAGAVGLLTWGTWASDSPPFGGGNASIVQEEEPTPSTWWPSRSIGESGTIVTADGGPNGGIPEVVDHGYVCDGAGEWVAYEGGPSPEEVKRRAEEIYTTEKCEELKLLDTCRNDGDYTDCPRLID